MLSLSGWLHAPKGIGVLYVRKGVRFRPFLRGGHQERGRRAGTENVPYIVGLGMAAQLAGQHMQEERTQVARLRDKLEQGLLAAIPDCMVNGDPENRLPNTTNIAFKNVEGEAILLMLDQLGICASSGSACTSGSLEPSHVLRAMGVPFTYAHGSVRLLIPVTPRKKKSTSWSRTCPRSSRPCAPSRPSRINEDMRGGRELSLRKKVPSSLHPPPSKLLHTSTESPPGLQA